MRNHTQSNAMVAHANKEGHLPRWEQANILEKRNSEKHTNGGGPQPVEGYNKHEVRILYVSTANGTVGFAATGYDRIIQKCRISFCMGFIGSGKCGLICFVIL